MISRLHTPNEKKMSDEKLKNTFPVKLKIRLFENVRIFFFLHGLILFYIFFVVNITSPLSEYVRYMIRIEISFFSLHFLMYD